MSKKKSSLLLLLIISLLFVISCGGKSPFTSEKGPLKFSSDTLKFDSIFTTLPSPTEWLVVTNPTINNLKVSKVWLESGAASEFELIIDGLKVNEMTDMILAPKDSIHIFAKMKSQARDKFVEEYLAFKVGTETQKVLLRAYVLDAYFYNTHVSIDDSNNIQIDTFFCNLTLTNDKPHVISGPMYIPEGCNLTIQAGAQIYFTPYKAGFYDYSSGTGGKIYDFMSMLYIGGTLKIQGQAGNPVSLQGTRLQTQPDPLYNFVEHPDQWNGIILTTTSTDNVIEYATIKNGKFGIYVDSSSVNNNPKLTMRYSRIRNMSSYGLQMGLGYLVNPKSPQLVAGGLGSVPALLVENCIIGDCGQYGLNMGRGGWGEFYNCTFYNNGRYASRNSQCVSVSNFITNEYVNYGPIDTRTRFVNCAMWGNAKSEISVNLLEGGVKEVNFENSLVKLDRTELNYDAYYTNVLENIDPLFYQPSERGDVRPKEGSPLIDAGKSDNLPYMTDVRGRLDSIRYTIGAPGVLGKYDIGAYEYYPIEK